MKSESPDDDLSTLRTVTDQGSGVTDRCILLTVCCRREKHEKDLQLQFCFVINCNFTHYKCESATIACRSCHKHRRSKDSNHSNHSNGQRYVSNVAARCHEGAWRAAVGRIDDEPKRQVCQGIVVLGVGRDIRVRQGKQQQLLRGIVSAVGLHTTYMRGVLRAVMDVQVAWVGCIKCASL